jgi:hypothetical protein
MLACVALHSLDLQYTHGVSRLDLFTGVAEEAACTRTLALILCKWPSLITLIEVMVQNFLEK